MACGCKGGKWTPPSSKTTGLTAAGAKASGLKGPQAPGYYATYNGPAAKESS